MEINVLARSFASTPFLAGDGRGGRGSEFLNPQRPLDWTHVTDGD